jgi:hypothetical protein
MASRPPTPPDAPTPPRHDARELRAARAQGRDPKLSEAYVRCLRRRVKLGMALHRKEDRPRQLPGRHDT